MKTSRTDAAIFVILSGKSLYSESTKIEQKATSITTPKIVNILKDFIFKMNSGLKQLLIKLNIIGINKISVCCLKTKIAML